MIYLAAGCFLLLLYSYVGFPLLVWLRATLSPRKDAMDEMYRPTISIVLSIYNEQKVLERCLHSLVNLNYPSEKMEILCGSDGSTDRTNAIIHALAENHSNIRAFFFPNQRGKMAVLNELVSVARNEILLFVDADIAISPNALLDYVRHFADESVGAAAGRYILLSPRQDGLFKSESAFLSFESNLRKNESLLHSTVGLNGANYAMRRNLWSPIPDRFVHDDLFGVLRVVSRGKRVLYEENAVAAEYYGRTYRDEFLRKSRGSARGFQTLFAFPRLLFGGPIAWMVWPHKIIRFMTGYFAATFLFSTSLLYARGAQWVAPIIALEAFLGVAIACGWLLRISRKSLPIVSELYWFFEMNLAFMWGCLQFLFRQVRPTWPQTSQVLSVSNIEEAAHS